MMEIICVANGDYERYEELLLQRDQLEKEAYRHQLAYTREFGDLAIECFQLKIDCIALKKSIAFCIAAKNRGEKPDLAALSELLLRQMAAYTKQLDDMVNEQKAARGGRPLAPYEVSEIKKIYRRIAKMLHPDISPLTEMYPELGELFQRVMIAYQCNDLQELRNLEVLINKVLSDYDIETVNMAIPNVAERILELENEIEQILTTEPYIYKYLFEDEFKIQIKKDELKKEIEEYCTYKAQLEKQYRNLMNGELNE
ncbi:MAG: hypothetical protein HUJ69_09850 [Lachnospiraceae bacterium]|nr:hypothetical protein [Lachnospiraceae bacterium]